MYSLQVLFEEIKKAATKETEVVDSLDFFAEDSDYKVIFKKGQYTYQFFETTTVALIERLKKFFKIEIEISDLILSVIEEDTKATKCKIKATVNIGSKVNTSSFTWTKTDKGEV